MKFSTLQRYYSHFFPSYGQTLFCSDTETKQYLENDPGSPPNSLQASSGNDYVTNGSGFSSNNDYSANNSSGYSSHTKNSNDWQGGYISKNSWTNPLDSGNSTSGGGYSSSNRGGSGGFIRGFDDNNTTGGGSGGYCNNDGFSGFNSGNNQDSISGNSQDSQRNFSVIVKNNFYFDI